MHELTRRETLALLAAGPLAMRGWTQ